eukprot:5070590-Alexandrium_andersonii.AAC.1
MSASGERGRSAAIRKKLIDSSRISRLFLSLIGAAKMTSWTLPGVGFPEGPWADPKCCVVLATSEPLAEKFSGN